MSHKFRNDYDTLGHERILNALAKYRDEENIAYGEDVHTKRVEEIIKNIFNCADAKVHLISGGTQTNLVMISAALKHHEAVISIESGHINVHESGAVEGSGYKIIPVKGKDGKVQAEGHFEEFRLRRPSER